MNSKNLILGLVLVVQSRIDVVPVVGHHFCFFWTKFSFLKKNKLICTWQLSFSLVPWKPIAQNIPYQPTNHALSLNYKRLSIFGRCHLWLYPCQKVRVDRWMEHSSVRVSGCCGILSSSTFIYLAWSTFFSSRFCNEAQTRKTQFQSAENSIEQ